MLFHYALLGASPLMELGQSIGNWQAEFYYCLPDYSVIIMPFLILFDIHCHHNEVLSMAALVFLNPDITDFGYWENMVGPTFHGRMEECNKNSSSGTPLWCRNHIPHLRKFKMVILPGLKREQRLHSISCLVLRFRLHRMELLVWDNCFWFERPSCSTLISWYKGTTSCGSPSDHRWSKQTSNIYHWHPNQ